MSTLTPLAVARRCLCSAICLSLLAGSAMAADIKPSLDLRYRFESVDDAAVPESANAHTLRARLQVEWTLAEHWLLLAGVEHTANLNDGFNSTRNGESSHAVVADPRNTELDQLFVRYSNDSLTATVGRQVVNLDNQRYIGAVGWRQNEQTFDALALTYKLDGGATVDYRYLDRVIRVFGEHHPNELLASRSLDGHLINIRMPLATGTLGGYGYWVEDRDVATDSNRTLGLRYSISSGADNGGRWSAQLDWANQHPYANSPLPGTASYWRIEPSVKLGAATVMAGWEHLGGDGNYSFRTPLATGHAFNGWADRFLATPANGLDDTFVGASGKAGRFAWQAVAHRFDSDSGGQHYGNEIDLSLGTALGHGFTGLLKLADFQGDALADTRKVWLQIDYHY